MMKHRLLCLFAVLIYTMPLLAGGTGPTVVNASGGNITSADIQVDFSVGEVVTADISIHTFGFLQPTHAIVTSVAEIQDYEKGVVFPNPAHDYLSWKKEIPVKKVTIFNVSGQKVQEEDMPASDIAIRDLASGVYFVKFTDFTGKESEVIKLIKN